MSKPRTRTPTKPAHVADPLPEGAFAINHNHGADPHRRLADLESTLHERLTDLESRVMVRDRQDAACRDRVTTAGEGAFIGVLPGAMGGLTPSPFVMNGLSCVGGGRGQQPTSPPPMPPALLERMMDMEKRFESFACNTMDRFQEMSNRLAELQIAVFGTTH